MEILIGFAAWLFFAAIVGVAAGRRDRSGAGYFLMSLLLSPLVAGVWLMAVGSGGMVCPRCRETVRHGAQACRFCGAVFPRTASLDLGPAAPLLVGVLLAPVVLVIVHAAALKMNVRFLLPLLVIALAVVIWVRLAPSLRDKSSEQLVAWVRGRPLFWQVGAGVIAICELLTLGDAAVGYFQHRPVSAATALLDDCASSSAWGALSDEVRAMATPEERYAMEGRRAACQDLQQKQSTAHYVQQCSVVAQHLLAGQFTPADRAVLAQPLPASGEYLSDPTGAFAARIASRTLIPGDVGQLWYPCGPATRPAFLTAVAESVTLWSSIENAKSVPEELMQELGASPGDAAKATAPMTAASKAALHDRAEAGAGQCRPKASGDCAGSVEMCELDARFGIAPGSACIKVAKTEAALQAADERKQKVEAARAEAQAAASERCTKSCDGLMPNGVDDPDDRWDKCMERCAGIDKLNAPLQ
jgi:hypothetical protein